jgi:hypothetical protein
MCRYLPLSVAILGSLSAFSATAQERCFQLGQSVCKQLNPGQPSYLHTCERYGENDFRLTFKGTICEAESSCIPLWHAWKAARDNFNQQCGDKELTEAEFQRCEVLEAKIHEVNQQLDAHACGTRIPWELWCGRSYPGC